MNRASERKEKTIWISAANVSACFAVIVLHANGIFWTFPKGRLWITSTFLETFFYWAVPAFFMISGATLMDYRTRYSTGIFFKKRFQRTVIPYLVWSVIAILYRRFVSGWERESLPKMIEGVFNNKYISVYWFFMPLFAVYLSIPLLSAIDIRLRKKIFLWFSAGTFILTSVLPFVFEASGLQYNAAIQIPVTGGYVLYVMLGYLIENNELSRSKRNVIYLAGIAGWLTQFLGTLYINRNSHTINRLFKGYMRFPAVLQAVGIIVFFKYFPWMKLPKILTRFIRKISALTFGIYLMHYYFIDLIPNVMKINSGSLSWRIGGAAAIFVICSILSAAISRIPVIKKGIGM